MRVAVAGAGFSGSYLARRLVEEGIARPEQIEIFDPGNHRTKCGINPCGFGIHAPTLKEAADRCNLDSDHILQEFDRVKIGNVSAKADLCTFDKPAFIEDCLKGLPVNNFELPGDFTPSFTTVVDATASRAVIGGSNGSHRYCYTRQVRIPWEKMPVKVDTLEVTPLPGPGSGPGYLWRFPLDQEVHYGYGVVGKDVRKGRHPSWFLPPMQSVVCGCRGVIRMSSPKYSRPLWMGNTIAVGESAGMISSATGGGCKEAIDGIETLIKHWGDWHECEKQLLKEFRWADREYDIVDKLCRGEKLNVRDYRTIHKNSKRVGFKLTLKETIDMIKFVLTGGD